ncbi:hypothetical protein Patl1_07716 [Pistacia atlantica]|uniref:Uncharacterized protein n=1 Tax=Pistacia atlantica TaxID=434234 RepID=A0ACC1AEW9_9ROSI|nr:hypothetical protein Patl1_07716 [Pistacia atlantica]
MGCQWMGRRDVLIVNPNGSNQVDPESSESEKILKKWYSQNPSKTVIATGFIASTPDNMPTTLKRNGSDNPASIMGALLRARQVTIWTYVDGVYSADPRKVSQAVIPRTLSYHEAWEMSYFGANVLHPRTIIPVMRYDIPKGSSSVLKEEFNIDSRVMGITGSRNTLLSDSGIDLLRWRELLKEKGEVADLNKFTQDEHGNHFFPNTVLVDCTADSHVASCYHDWLLFKAEGPSMEILHTLLFEATVGAGLPIISTLCRLLETGDKIMCTEGISGTQSFSEVAAEAKEAGYTELDPRDDLSGTDTHKMNFFLQVIILARDSGLKLELSDLPVHSLVPEPLRTCASAEEFTKQLLQYDQELSKERQEAEDAGEVSFVENSLGSLTFQ